MKSLNNLNIYEFAYYERVFLNGSSNIGKKCLIEHEKTGIKASCI
jgi:hypothetical protein